MRECLYGIGKEDIYMICTKVSRAGLWLLEAVAPQVCVDGLLVGVLLLLVWKEKNTGDAHQQKFLGTVCGPYFGEEDSSIQRTAFFCLVTNQNSSTL